MATALKKDSTAEKAIDHIQVRLATYASSLCFSDLPQEVVAAAKLRIVDTLGAMIGGYFGEPCRIARAVAATNANENGASVIGSRLKTSVDLAAFANATAARYLEYTDFYHWPGSLDGHASDIVGAALAAAEHVQASGQEFIASVVLGYEAFLRLCDVLPNGGFDYTNCSTLGSAVAAGKLMKLSPAEMAHCISLAVVPNVILKQVRREGKTGFKPTASGHAGRAGVFAAQLARAGMEGPNLPFEGKFGFCAHVIGKSFTLDALGGDGARFKILDSQIKIRPSERNTVPLILAAEKLAPTLSAEKIARIIVEVYSKAIDAVGTGAEIWNPQSREDAYHSIPYVVAAALTDHSVTLRSFDESHLRDPNLRRLIQKVEIQENAEFTRAFQGHPVQHRARITIVYIDDKRVVAEVGGPDEVRPDAEEAQIVGKFRSLTEDVLGRKRVAIVLDQLLHLEDVADVSTIPPGFLI